MDKATFVVLASCLRKHHGICSSETIHPNEWSDKALAYLIKKDYGALNYDALIDCFFHHEGLSPHEYYDKHYVEFVSCNKDEEGEYLAKETLFNLWMECFPASRRVNPEGARTVFYRFSADQMCRIINDATIQKELEWETMRAVGEEKLIPEPRVWLVNRKEDYNQ